MSWILEHPERGVLTTCGNLPMLIVSKSRAEEMLDNMAFFGNEGWKPRKATFAEVEMVKRAA